jgi:DNA-binding LytR/AlgR family response regulator
MKKILQWHCRFLRQINMQVVIVEDEKPAAERLSKALVRTDGSIEIKKILNTVSEAISWFRQNPMPELVFMDIELTDGLSFAIFECCHITCPVIFTTAYDEYWQQAFEHNSIDYLLKPLKMEKLQASLAKYQKMKTHFVQNLKQFLPLAEAPGSLYKKRILVKRGTDLVAIRTDDIAYFYAIHKVVCLIHRDNQKFVLDRSLSDIEKDLEPSVFFRINRKYLVSINSISRISFFGKGKLNVLLSPPADEEVVISSETAAAFKAWMDK